MQYERDYYYRRCENPTAGEKIGYLLIGGGIGAVIALLFAPKPGVELRGDIADATRRGFDKTKEAAAQSQVVKKAGEYYEVAKDKAGDYYEVAKDKASDYYLAAGEKAFEIKDAVTSKASEVKEMVSEKVQDVKDQAKDTAMRTSNPISAAIEAGKQAYYEEKRRTDIEALVGGEDRPKFPSAE